MDLYQSDQEIHIVILVQTNQKYPYPVIRRCLGRFVDISESTVNPLWRRPCRLRHSTNLEGLNDKVSVNSALQSTEYSQDGINCYFQVDSTLAIPRTNLIDHLWPITSAKSYPAQPRINYAQPESCLLRLAHDPNHSASGYLD